MKMSWRDFFALGQWLDHPCRNTELDPIPLRPAPHVANIQTSSGGSVWPSGLARGDGLTTWTGGRGFES